MLAIIRALKKWRCDLLGSKFIVYTDHQTLRNFDAQRELSKRQARWMEYMSQYDCTITYINGDDNCVADALSRLPDDVEDNSCVVASVFEIRSDPGFMQDIKDGYHIDLWCKALTTDLTRGVTDSKLGITSRNGLIFIGQCLVIPKHKNLRESLFHLSHDNLGHFGAGKSYNALQNDFYWPNMRKDLVNAYVPSCTDCQRNKDSTLKPGGPLHPLPVPDKRFESVVIDFVGPLLKDDRFDCIVTMTDRLNTDVQLAPCKSNMTTEEFATVFFDRWFCENGCPLELITDRDKLFVSRFWKALMKLTGIKHKMSTAYHPQTDGASERSNKTVIQALRFHVERNQTGWVKALPKVRFDIMNMVNASTGVTPFMLKSGHSPRLIPPLIDPEKGVLTTNETDSAIDQGNAQPAAARSDGEECAEAVMSQLADTLLEAKDSLMAAKISQAHHANKDRCPDPCFKVGD
jgi:hypothetical protein